MRWSALAPLAIVLGSPTVAFAEADVAPSRADAPPRADEKRFAFVADPRTPPAGAFVTDYSIGVSSVDVDRPLPTALGASGIVHTLSLSYGVTDWFAPYVSATMAQPTGKAAAPAGTGDQPPPSSGSPSGDGTAFRATGAFGARFQIGDRTSPFRAGVIASGYRELGGTLGASVRVSASYDIGRLRLAGNVLLQHAFASDRDAIDYLAFAGFSYRVLDQLRLGAEWVGQDLEGAWSNEIEGGAKNYVGPTVSVDLDRSRLQLLFSPSYGIGPGAAHVLWRASLAVGF